MGNNQDFVHLHLHSEYSLLDGACRIKQIFKRVKELGQTAVAITDHGVLYGAIEFYKTAKENGIKPIIGCEVYVAPRTRFDKEHHLDSSPYHLILLCKDILGYQNLVKIVSKSHLEGFYNKPRVDIDLLEKYHKGLICLSSCIAGEIPRKLLNGQYEEAKTVAQKYLSIFGQGNYYIEVQNHNLEDELRILPKLYKLSSELEIPLAATNDCHYVSKEDAETQRLLLCIQLNKTIDEPLGMGFDNDEFYLKSTEEMYELFKNHKDAVLNTSLIAEKCNLEMEFGHIKLPKFEIDNVEDNIKYFSDICYKGMYEKYGNNPSEDVVDRLKYEIEVITKMGYTDYYLIVWDFINYARNNDVAVGPGRGSGAGSLCAYCIGITGIDPIKFNLLFERFLNPERVSMPDFDIDFCVEGRQKVKDYVIRRYGADKVSEIIAFDTLKARAAIRDVGRVLNIPYGVCDKIAKLIGYHPNLNTAIEKEPDLKVLYNTNSQVKKIIDIASKVENMVRHTTTHAAGVVISAVTLSDIVPLQKNDNTVVTQYDMVELESIGLLKMDFLGLRNLSVISDTVEIIRKSEPTFDINKIPIDDKDVFKLFCNGETSGVFQFESKGMRNVVERVIPNNLEDLIAIISLYRPGPMDSIPQYIKNKQNPELVKYKHPLLKEILEQTFGCIIYQEQVMEIFRKLAGYSYGRADIVRRAMSKKKHDVMIKERDSFIEGTLKNGISQDVANSIFDEMISFASYAFNKSHAASYAYLAYQTAYLKCHYFKYYMSSLLTSVIYNTPKLLEYLALCKSKNILIKPPDINISQYSFSVFDNDIYFGLLAIKNVGRGVVDKIILERNNNGRFISFQDFFERVQSRDLNKRSVENMIKAGVFDKLDLNRRQMLENYEELMEKISTSTSSEIEGQLNFLDLVQDNSNVNNITFKKVEEYSTKLLLSMEKEATGVYLSGNPLDSFDYVKKLLKTQNIASIDTEFFKAGANIKIICSVNNLKPYVAKNGSKMAFLVLEDDTGEIEGVVFSDLYIVSANKLVKDEVVMISGKVSVKDEKISIICESILDESDILLLINQMRLCLKLKSNELEKYNEIARICEDFVGNVELCIYLEDKNKFLVPKNKVQLEVNHKLYEKIIKVISDDKIGLIQ